MAEGEEAEDDAKAGGIEHGGDVVDVAVAPNGEEVEDDANATGIEHGGAVDVAVAPIAEVVESEETSGRTEKGKEVAADVDSEKTIHAVGARVACLSTRNNLYLSADVVKLRETKTGLEYYVHYIDYDKRLDEWLPSTRVVKWSQGILSPFKSPSVISTSPAKVGSGTADTQIDTTGTPERRVTRHMKRRLEDFFVAPKPTEELAPLVQSLEKEHEEKTKVKNIQVVWLGKYEVVTWYHSPYPGEYYHQHRLYICEFCLKYMRKKKSVDIHKMKCKLKSPPGNEIYKTTAPIKEQVRASEGTVLENTPSISGTESISSKSVQHLSVYEVDGSKSKLYCQNLCLLAGLFLDHKTLHYSVDSFLFYILTENDAFGKHPVAYFSKDKESADNYIIACILTLPPFQRKRYGRFLIAFAYELSKKEGKIGTPERPLSDFGRVSFNSYWKRVLLETLRDNRNVSFKDLTAMTFIQYDDFLPILRSLGLTRFWRGDYYPFFRKRIIDEELKPLRPEPEWLTIDTTKLEWLPTPKKTLTPRRPR